LTEADIVRLEHWIYGATHEKGYGNKAMSRDLNVALYEHRLSSHFTPVRVEKTTNGDAVVDARMLHPSPATDELLLSLLGRGPADEYNRPTIMNHTAIVPVRILKSGLVTLGMVETALRDFDRLYPNAVGRVDPLVVPLRSEPEAARPFGDGVRRLISKAAMETLATRLMTDQHGRTLLLVRGSSNLARNELLYKMVELLCFACDMPLFTCISDAPTLSAMNHFRLAVSGRGVRADSSWMLLDGSIDKEPLKHARSKGLIYERIASAFEKPRGEERIPVGAVSLAP
jgi:hypothetical protein